MESNIVYLPVYSQQQYPRLLEIVSDIQEFEEKWEGWFQKYLAFKSDMEKKGFHCMEVLIDVEELNNYCVLNQLKNNSTNRELFTLKLVAIL